MEEIKLVMDVIQHYISTSSFPTGISTQIYTNIYLLLEDKWIDVDKLVIACYSYSS